MRSVSFACTTFPLSVVVHFTYDWVGTVHIYIYIYMVYVYLNNVSVDVVAVQVRNEKILVEGLKVNSMQKSKEGVSSLPKGSP